uniref:Protein SDA1 n=1 Tax=Araucaria cunninghamii TaxID=56994 RepID=A0A0D6QXD4_ARACU
MVALQIAGAEASAGIKASGRSSEKLSLTVLQSRMKCDPAGYESELLLLVRHFESCLTVFQQHAALKSASMGSDPGAAKELGELTLFLAHVATSYPQHLSHFPKQLAELLQASGHSLPSALRRQITQALVLLMNRQMIELAETLPLFVMLQTLEDKELKKLAFSHIVQYIRRMNRKHKNDVKNRALQSILFALLQEEHESKAKSALAVLCDLHRRKVWFDERTGNAICTACFHKSSKIMIAALSFILGYEQNSEEEDEDSSSDEDMAKQKPYVVLSREAVYKAHHKGTTKSKKKKQAKLERVMRGLKKQQRIESKSVDWGSYSPLRHLKDPQAFAEKLFSRLQTCNERFEVKMMIMKVIARAVGLHRLILLNFYPFLQKYVQPHQRDVTQLLAAAVQACHDLVPPDCVEPLLKQLVNQFVHDRARTEVIAVGLNVVREICIRIPLLMTEDLLRDLALYKKSHEKAVSSAARSLIGVFRQICPSLLDKKDRGRVVDNTARPRAFGEKVVASDVPGAELLLTDHDPFSNGESDSEDDADEENVQPTSGGSDNDGSDHADKEGTGDESEDANGNIVMDSDTDDDESASEEDEGYTDYNEEIGASQAELFIDEESGSDQEIGSDTEDEASHLESETRKRKSSELKPDKNLSGESLRSLKRFAAEKAVKSSFVNSEVQSDRILSNEDFERIRELQARKAAKLALSEHGMMKFGSGKGIPAKLPSSEHLSEHPINPAKLEVNIRRRKDKDERLATVKAGREGRLKYASRTAVKQKKTGGLTNQQKERKKGMPLAAKRAKVARSQKEKKRQQSSKQFRGKKAWK